MVGGEFHCLGRRVSESVAFVVGIIMSFEDLGLEEEKET